MTKLKILHINTLDSSGGASQVAVDLLMNLEEETHLVVKEKTSVNPRVIKLKKSNTDYLFLIIDKILWKLGGHKPIRTFLSFDNELNNTYSKLKRLKEYQEADIIHLHNLHGGYFDFKAFVKIASEKKIVWTLHDMWALTGGEAYTFENTNYKKGIGYTPYIHFYPLLNPIVDRRQYFLEKKRNIYKQIHEALTVVPVSKWLNKCFHEAYVYNHEMQLNMIHNGIDTSVFFNKNSRNWSKPRILFFNLDNPFKGGELFINIIEKIKIPFDLFIVGKKLRTNFSYTHLPYINDRTLLSETYNQSDILIFPSLAENFPLTVLEAMSCGVCVIASDTGGIPEMLDDSCGFIFKTNNQLDLLTKTELALNDMNLVRNKAKLAEKRVHENFTLKKNCDDYSHLYREILSFSNWEKSEVDWTPPAKPVKVAKFFQ